MDTSREAAAARGARETAAAAAGECQRAPPSISVIIPNHNRAATLGACIEAALASRYAAFEVIVVDDASDDGSPAVVERYPCRLVRLDRRSGAAHARNAGARASRGEVLFFTDADCLMLPETLATAAATLARADSQAIAGGSYTPLPHDRRFCSEFQSILVNHFETKRSGDADYLATHALAIPARIFADSQGFREELLLLEDVEFSHRLRRLGYRLVMNPALQVRHVFGFSLRRSLANAARKARHWTLYSLRNGDLFADSGTASAELKLNGVVYAMSLALAAAALLTGDASLLVPVGAGVAVNLYASRRLLHAFRSARGTAFACAASAYYLLIYPLPVLAGALAGTWCHFGAVLRSAGRS